MMNAYAITDVGKQRQVNQDYVFCTKRAVGRLKNLFIVADGMGGHKAGDLASKFSVQTFVELVKDSSSDNPISAISDAIKCTNDKLIELAGTSADYEGMGTTFVVATIDGKSVYIANIGDSRLYVFSNGELRQVTRDHSLVEEMVDRGLVDRDEARTHARKNYITRAMGGGEEVMADFFEIEIADGDILLMCTDGLSNMIPDDDMAAVLASEDNIEAAARQLVEMANNNGGKDNISVLLIKP